MSAVSVFSITSQVEFDSAERLELRSQAKKVDITHDEGNSSKNEKPIPTNEKLQPLSSKPPVPSPGSVPRSGTSSISVSDGATTSDTRRLNELLGTLTK